MNSDLEVKTALEKLHTIAVNHSNNIHTQEEIEEGIEILSDIVRYAYSPTPLRIVQIHQVEDNIGSIRRILNGLTKEGEISALCNHIDNLERYIHIQ